MSVHISSLSSQAPWLVGRKEPEKEGERALFSSCKQLPLVLAPAVGSLTLARSIIVCLDAKPVYCLFVLVHLLFHAVTDTNSQ